MKAACLLILVSLLSLFTRPGFPQSAAFIDGMGCLEKSYPSDMVYCNRALSREQELPLELLVKVYMKRARLHLNKTIGNTNEADNRENQRKAFADLSAAVKADPTHSDALISRGAMYGDLGNPKNAIEDATLALGYDRRNARGYFVRATNLRRLGRNAEAIADYKEALKHDPDPPTTFRIKQALTELNASP